MARWCVKNCIEKSYVFFVEKEEDAYVEKNEYIARDVDELFSTTRIVPLYVHPGVFHDA